MPKECDEKAAVRENDSDDSDDDATQWSDDDDVTECPSFPEFHRVLTDAISDLGGSVFPKLNWSSPKDATWMGFANSLRCTTPSQVNTVNSQ